MSAASLPLGEVVPRAHLLDSDHDVYSCRLTVHLHGRSEAHRLSSNLHDHRGVYILRNEKNQTASKSVPYSVEVESMSNRSLSSCFVKQATSNLIALSCLTLSGLAAADTFGPVPKAV